MDICSDAALFRKELKPTACVSITLFFVFFNQVFYVLQLNSKLDRPLLLNKKGVTNTTILLPTLFYYYFAFS